MDIMCHFNPAAIPFCHKFFKKIQTAKVLVGKKELMIHYNNNFHATYITKVRNYLERFSCIISRSLSNWFQSSAHKYQRASHQLENSGGLNPFK